MPNVGKSTLFNTLTKCSIPAENFPFCTIDPNNVRPRAAARRAVRRRETPRAVALTTRCAAHTPPRRRKTRRA